MDIIVIRKFEKKLCHHNQGNFENEQYFDNEKGDVYQKEKYIYNCLEELEKNILWDLLHLEDHDI